ncbi:MAG: GDP-mannose 4,6-dehydratase [Lachnospiraceae bacterium]|nr:GDP-mannose 4,6-dehydratase [Lachnospiraceae bacterium]
MKVLVTGGTGMIGSHFMESFKKDGHEVYGIARNSATSRMAAVQDKSIIRSDILERDAMVRIFDRIKPDIIIHMAAQAFNGDSWNLEFLTHQTNYIGTLNVLYAAHEVVPEAKILLACSSAEYGNITEADCPLVEERLLKPHTPYGVSKVGVENLGLQYALNYGMKIYLPRLFIHVGTGHPPATAIQNFARQVALIKKGVIEPEIHVGNLTSARDFIDVRDGVRAMRMILDKGNPAEPYNICNGKAYKIQEILDMLIEISGTDAKVVSDKSLFRLADEPLLLGDNSKIAALGYEREYSMHKTLEDVFADWESRI